MPFTNRQGVSRLSQLSIDADLAMGAHNISLGAGQTVDSVDVSVSAFRINSGTYTGDGSGEKTIAHGLGVIPRLVILRNTTNATISFLFHTMTSWIWLAQGTFAMKTVTAANSTNFYGESASHNTNLAVYEWIAIGIGS